MDDSGNTGEFVERRYSSTLMGIVNTVEWVILALILAFVFRAFVMEAFRIPTGSMAETLRGAHHHLRCVQCGFKYDLGADSVGSGGPKCPSCGFGVETPIAVPASNGDRILVLKCIYEFMDPQRWDVVVFKNPSNPGENYIKRMIALPGETIEALDGDYYIDGKIARKPPKVQGELWMPIYENDYQPVAATVQSEGKQPFDWSVPFVNTKGSKWVMNHQGTSWFNLASEPSSEHTIAYKAALIDDFRAYYAYNQTVQYRIEKVCTDLRVRYWAHLQSEEGFVGAGVRKYNSLYRGRVGFDGKMVIEKLTDGSDEVIELAKGIAGKFNKNRGVLFEFSLVDRQLILTFGDEKLKYDLGQKIEDLSYSETTGSLVEISGGGNVKLSHVGVYRDTQYTERTIRPRPGKPFTLGKDEFFVCGDNSPHSHDSRMWADPGDGNNGKTYTAGVVPRDYLMGKAFYLYWGDAFKPLGTKVPIIPNFSETKVIYGGSDKEL